MTTMEKAMMNFGLGSQTYAAPRAEGVALSNEGLLCGSEKDTKGGLEKIGTDAGIWDKVEAKYANEVYGGDEIGGTW